MRPPGTSRTGCAVVSLALAGMLLSLLAGFTGASHGQQAEARVPDVTTDAAPATEVLPADQLQRCATKALRGDFGHVPAWKLALYRGVIERGVTVQCRIKRTNYCPKCSGRTCADGSRVRRGICAAPERIPMHSIVWTATDGILNVCDRGGAVQAAPSRFLRAGEAMVIDVWQPSCGPTCEHGTRRLVPFAVIERAATDPQGGVK